MTISRRQVLGGLLASGAAATLGAACSDEDAPAGGVATSSASADAPPAPRYLPFHGAHQTGITEGRGEYGLMAAFSTTAGDRDALAETMQVLTTEIRRLMGGEPYEEREPAYPPLYTGHVGNPPPPADLSVVVSVGASVFDDRFGLADAKPAELVKMPFLANDRLDPARSHGDVLLTIDSAHEDVNLFALRQLARATRGTLALHWMLDGYNRRTAAKPGEAGVRNLMGFVDGTANLRTDDGESMDRFVWVGDGDDEPTWAVGGSYQAVRVIRMFVEFWDRTRLLEQEALIGRRKLDGAPLGGEAETDVPDYEADPDGEVIPLDAHIRLANPRTPETAGDLLLRRGFSFSRGFDGAGHLDQGLAFVSYQRRLQQFLNVSARLKGEPLEEYLEPQGGGFFFALPGVRDERDWLGRSLLTRH